jgi:hypothetical protein
MRKRYLTCLSALLLLGLVPVDAAQALAFRCNSYVIDVGMHKAEVMQKCGLPALRDQKTERRRIGLRQFDPSLMVHPNQNAGNRVRHARNYEHQFAQETAYEIDVQIEEWVYNFGPQRFMQLLRFEDGRLKQIQDLASGH